MPPKKVYGKSRAVYDPHAIFNSPVKRPRADAPGVKSKAAAEISAGPGTQHVDSTGENEVGRKALGDVNVNRTVLPGLLSKDRTKASRKPKRLVVVDDSDDDEEGRKQFEDARSNADPGWHVEQPIEEKTEKSLGQHQRDPVRLTNDTRAQDRRRLRPNREDESTHIYDQQASAYPVVETPSIPSSMLSISEIYNTHCSELLELSSHPMCNFSTWSSELAAHFHLLKIAEASFGEVYRLKLTKHFSQLHTTDESVFKIIPLKPPLSLLPKDKRKRNALLKKAEPMSSPSAVANEVQLLQRMRSIPGYTNFRDVRVVQGRPPRLFLDAFQAFNAAQKAKGKDPSLFPDPSKPSSYTDDQLWAVIEMQDAGTDLEQLLESGECATVWHVWDVFWQVTLSLAKGEDLAQFEHRDLHLGNICVRYEEADGDAVTPAEVPWDVNRKLGFTHVETTIIDYTISRALLEDYTTIAYYDLATEPGLFEGDSSEEYQYDIYRYMRGAVFHNDPYNTSTKPAARGVGEGGERSWEQYHPITNILWLHFILHKFLENLREWPSAVKAPSKKIKKQADAYARWKRAIDLEHVLLRVQGLLAPGAVVGNELISASHLVNLALREGWIGVEDGMGGEAESEVEESVLVERLRGLDVSDGVGT